MSLGTGSPGPPLRIGEDKALSLLALPGAHRNWGSGGETPGRQYGEGGGSALPLWEYGRDIKLSMKVSTKPKILLIKKLVRNVG